MTARRLLLTLVVLATTGLAACASQVEEDHYPTARPVALPKAAAPTARAQLACQYVAAVQKQAKGNADRELVFSYLDAAVREISLAARTEPIWISLQSGIESIQHGLQRDDEAASELGIAIARDQCRRAEVYLPGAVRPSGTSEPPDSSRGPVTPLPTASAS